MDNNRFQQLIKLNLILVFLVIAAGSFVRMTGSGMGCPDWPKCFGYLIPPTERVQLEWKPNHYYKKGQVIIRKESLEVVKQDFTSASEYQSHHWEPYTKHDYAQFNVYHTWIEFINRLLGALAGLTTLALLVASSFFWSQSKRSFFLSLAIVLGMGFQAWLGKTVVDSNLLPMKITLHMGMALVIVALLVGILHISIQRPPLRIANKNFLGFTLFALLLSLLQIAMGTQVRQYVDQQMHQWQLLQPEKWLANSPLIFYIHRSFSLLVLGVNGYLAWQLKKYRLHNPTIYWVMGCIGFEILTGIAMYYFDFPIASQPLHLVVAAVLFATQFYILLQQQFIKTQT